MIANSWSVELAEYIKLVLHPPSVRERDSGRSLYTNVLLEEEAGTVAVLAVSIAIFVFLDVQNYLYQSLNVIAMYCLK
jgi:hypothetical protein